MLKKMIYYNPCNKIKKEERKGQKQGLVWRNEMVKDCKALFGLYQAAVVAGI